jgi:hypothetical protein
VTSPDFGKALKGPENYRTLCQRARSSTGKTTARESFLRESFFREVNQHIEKILMINIGTIGKNQRELLQ